MRFDYDMSAREVAQGVVDGYLILWEGKVNLTEKKVSAILLCRYYGRNPNPNETIQLFAQSTAGRTKGKARSIRANIQNQTGI